MLRALGNGLKSAVGIALVGATGYCAWDAVGDAAVYSTTKRRVLEAAESHKRLRDRLGAPIAAGPWYDATVVFGHYGHTATVTFPLRGPEKASDVIVKLVRKGGLASATLFSLLQGDQWEVMLMDVAVGMGPGGQPLVMSLLEEEEPELGGQPGAGHCAPCSAKA